MCITDVDVLNDLKAQEGEKAEIERQKLERKRMQEERKAEREKMKKEKEERKLMKQLEKERKRKLKDKTLREEGKKKKSSEQLDDLSERLELLDVQDTVDNEEDAICPKCGLSYLGDVGNLWVQCEGCGKWYDFKCTKIKSKKCIPDSYLCEDCK